MSRLLTRNMHLEKRIPLIFNICLINIMLIIFYCNFKEADDYILLGFHFLDEMEFPLLK